MGGGWGEDWLKSRRDVRFHTMIENCREDLDGDVSAHCGSGNKGESNRKLLPGNLYLTLSSALKFPLSRTSGGAESNRI
jgi:hypothetical protein